MPASTRKQTKPQLSFDPIHVLLVGNNPSELTKWHKLLKSYRRKIYMPYFSFSINDAIKVASKNNLHSILLDGSLEKSEIKAFVSKLKKHKKTADIPVTIIKSSNHQEISTQNVQDYLLKSNLDSLRLSQAISKVIKLKELKLEAKKKAVSAKRKGVRLFDIFSAMRMRWQSQPQVSNQPVIG